MGDYKPVLYSVGFLLVIGLVLNIFVAPFIDTDTVVTDSILDGFIDFVENGFNITIPVVGEFSVSPVTWLWLGIDSVTDKVVDQLELMTYIPDSILSIIIILMILSLAYTVVTLIRGN